MKIDTIYGAAAGIKKTDFYRDAASGPFNFILSIPLLSLSLCSSLFLFSEPLEIIKYISKLELVWWWWDPFFDGSRSFREWLSTQLGSMLLLCYLFMRNDGRLSPRRQRIKTAAEEWIRRILKFIVHASAILYLSTISFSSIYRCHGICGDASDVWVSRTYSSRYRRRLVTSNENRKEKSFSRDVRKTLPTPLSHHEPR